MVGTSTLRKAARKIGLPCCSFSRPQTNVDNNMLSSVVPAKQENVTESAEAESRGVAKNLCAICLEPLSYSTGDSSGQAIFTGQCSHAFHFSCISSNVRHGSVTCPICRAHWTQLPRNLNPPSSSSDPVLRILDDSIATFRVHRRSSLLSTRYDDDDPVEPHTHTHTRPRLHLTLHPNLQLTSYHLSVKLASQQATDLVLVASFNGPHLRLLKQSMALVVFSLRSIDRLAIVTYSFSATRAFPLRRMTSHGKRAALQVINRLFYMGQADPVEGLKKGIKILEDRAHKNPQSCILHLSDSPTRSYLGHDIQVPFPIHRFHVGFGFGTSNGFVMHEFEEFVARLLGGVIRDTQVRIGEGGVVRLGELRGGEERIVLVPLDLGECGFVCVGYSYIEGGIEECIRTGEFVLAIGDKMASMEAGGRDMSMGGTGRTSSVESWDYHDPYMARRWAKHLHGYRL
ncbi:hypothetical protein HHK36_005892 [Tetracentron sinense]|uniref:RING-type domain-containing protein n=1 Tax=Tetracentron sinense TaxID=13715 RepID=A0A835DMN7_TETSI|nr:hypothetical protein HHK36_005892 [Tetracentron sinense]